MGILKVEIPGEFKITIRANSLKEAIKKLEEIEKKSLLSLVGSVKDNETWKETKRKIENDMYGNDR